MYSLGCAASPDHDSQNCSRIWQTRRVYCQCWYVSRQPVQNPELVADHELGMAISKPILEQTLEEYHKQMSVNGKKHFTQS